MPKFIYVQQRGEEAWQECLADTRADVIAKKRPRFTTVLAVSALSHAQSTSEDLAALKYAGPLYFDWDAEDLSTAIEKFQQKDLGSGLYFIVLTD